MIMTIKMQAPTGMIHLQVYARSSWRYIQMNDNKQVKFVCTDQELAMNVDIRECLKYTSNE